MRVLPIVLCIATALAQDKPVFEVASIRPGSPDTPPRSRLNAGGSLTVTNRTLRETIIQAWDVQPFQVVGGPSWVDSARFDIQAKPLTKVKWEVMMTMMQALLADRFQLSMHREMRELPIYALVLAKKDGRLGPGLVQPSEGSCVAAEANSNITRPEPGKPFCHTVTVNRQFLHASGFLLTEFAGQLSEVLGRKVIDQTGLSGSYNINLEWTPDESLPDSPSSIFTAMQEQLGLKLESRKGPVEVWVIDRAEKPSEN